MCQERIIPVNDVHLWIAVQGEGRPIVLCHGGPGGYDYLKPVADMIDDRCEVVRYDQRGSGRSEVSGPYNVSTFVDDLEGMRRYFGFERWIIGGHSWGAGLALAYAVRFPDRTAAIIYLSGTGIDPGWHEAYRRNRLVVLNEVEREEFQRLRARRDGVEGKARDQLQKRRRELSKRAEVFDPTNLDNLPSFKAHPVSDEVNRAVGEDWNAYEENAAFRQAVYSLSMPAFFLHGAGDSRPARFVEALASQLAQGQFQVIPNAGHYPWIERPDEVRAALRSFVSELKIA